MQLPRCKHEPPKPLQLCGFNCIVPAKHEAPNEWRLVSLLCFAASLFVFGCANGGDYQNYRRVGETKLVSTDTVSLSNAVVAWSGSLTNGYSLLRDDEARRSFIGLLLNDPSYTYFKLMNKTNTVAPWGLSACDSSAPPPFFTVVVTRIHPASNGTSLAAAMHSSRVSAKGIGFNIHTGFERGGIIDLAPCPKDEQALIRQIEKFIP